MHKTVQTTSEKVITPKATLRSIRGLIMPLVSRGGGGGGGIFCDCSNLSFSILLDENYF
jgi:hypothetical protein